MEPSDLSASNSVGASRSAERTWFYGVTVFYGTDQARIHDTAFGNLAEAAAADVLALLATAGHRSGIVVDLGGGSGILARIVTDAGYHVVGVDISPDMVALAQTRPINKVGR